jgi:hypothetical protein
MATSPRLPRARWPNDTAFELQCANDWNRFQEARERKAEEARRAEEVEKNRKQALEWAAWQTARAIAAANAREERYEAEAAEVRLRHERMSSRQVSAWGERHAAARAAQAAE